MTPRSIVGFRSLALALILAVVPQIKANVTATVQPNSQIVFVGSNVTFSAFVSATAGETITSYSWRSSTNATGPFLPIAGATNVSYNITNAQVASSGYYYVAITYNSGTNRNISLLSTAATLQVLDQARIVTQPVSQVRIAGMSVSFSVGALGAEPLAFQWRLNGTNLNDGARVNGSATATLTLANLIKPDSGNYDVIVTNIYTAVTSKVATLQVLVPPSFDVPPVDSNVVLGSNFTFSVLATGDDPLSYQWLRYGTNLVDAGRFSGSKTVALTITNAKTNDAGPYQLIVTNLVGGITSSVANLTVLIPPTFTSPTNFTGKQGYDFSFTNTATGTMPITFGADALPTGLSLDPDTGIISGIPAVFGFFPVTIYATNAAVTVPCILGITLISDVPGITSAFTAKAKQGVPFSYSIAASNTPTAFAAYGLPLGLTLDPVGGVISGSPLVYGVFPVQIGASNLYGGDLQTLSLTVDSSVPVINSTLLTNGVQGQVFNYSITASNPAVSFAAAGLPPGINLDPKTGLISGPSILDGVFPVAITVFNQFGSDTQTLTLSIASTVPVITSALVATGIEETNFTYSIVATNTLGLPMTYRAAGLPIGLSLVDSNIVGAPLYGGTFNVLIGAANAYGETTQTLQLNVAYATNTTLMIDPNSVMHFYSSPYLLEFDFSLLNGSDPATADSVVRPPAQFKLTCLEDGVPIPSETAAILLPGNKKQFIGWMVLDYTYSMFSVPDAISNMQYSAELLINLEPPTAKFGVSEFHADYVTPQTVTNFITDKTVLTRTINGIETNYVQGNYAGTRAFDAIYAALGKFTGTNTDEARYLIVMTDGNDDSSLINTNATGPVNAIIGLAQTNNVRLYCVGFGASVNTNVLSQLAANTGGRYYEAAFTSDLPVRFSQIVKDIDGQYILRWATLKRGSGSFTPTFTLSLDGVSTTFSNQMATNVDVVVTNVVNGTNSISTNSVPTNVTLYAFSPTSPTVVGGVTNGQMRLVADADVGPSVVRLRATYVPRFVREIRVNYRANYAADVTMNSRGPGDFFESWNLSQTNDGAGGYWITLTSSNLNNLLSSLPYGIMGDLLTFKFHDPEQLTTNNAFSAFAVDNNIYTNFQPKGVTFTISNASSFITPYPAAGPHGTPVPWLVYYKIPTNNLANAELLTTAGGLPVWQAYLAGLNPTNASSTFALSPLVRPTNGVMPQIRFPTVRGRTYRVDTATAVGSWYVLEDNIPGTGTLVTVPDTRDLSGVQTLFYRVSVY